MTETVAVDSRPARPFAGTVSACLIADGGDFVSRPVQALTLNFAGIVGDFHAGLTRRSTLREPWYPRGIEIRNDRQVTIVSEEELAEVATLMVLPEIAPGWIGANLVLTGLPDLTLAPIGARLFFAVARPCFSKARTRRAASPANPSESTSTVGRDSTGYFRSWPGTSEA